MNEQEKKGQLVKFLIGKGFIDPASQEAEIAKMANALAPATAAEKGATSDIDKAFIAMQIEQGDLGGTAPTTGAAQPTAMSAADRMAISRTLSAQQVDRKKYEAGCAVQQFIVARPAQNTYISSTTGKVNYESWKNTLDKIASGEIKVVPEDQAKFDALKGSAVEGAELAANISSELPKTIKLFKVKVPDAPTAKFMDKDELCTMMLLKTNGRIADANDDTKPAVSLRVVGGKPDPSNAGAYKPTKVVVAVNHKKATFEDRSNYDIAMTPSKTAAAKDYTVRSKDSFRVLTNRKKADGTNITRVVTVPLTVSGQALEVRDEFASKFAKESASNKKKTVKLLDAIVVGVHSLLNDSRPEAVMLTSEYSAEFAAFSQANPTAPAGNI